MATAESFEAMRLETSCSLPLKTARIPSVRSSDMSHRHCFTALDTHHRRKVQPWHGKSAQPELSKPFRCSTTGPCVRLSVLLPKYVETRPTGSHQPKQDPPK